MTTTDTPRVLAPVGMTPDPWDTDETFAAEARRERERIDGRVGALRALADFIVERNMPAPGFLEVGFSISREGGDHDRVIAKWYANQDEAPALVKALGGTIDAPAVKDIDKHTGYLKVTRRLPDVPLTLQITVTGTVCEMVDTGRTETVEVDEDACPQCEGPVELTPSGALTCREHGSDHFRSEPPAKRKVTEQRPVYERRCPDSLLALADIDASGAA